MRLYFAHPVNVFGTALKWYLVEKVLRDTFTNWELEDPDQPHHQKGYADWKQRLVGDPTKSGGMSYYYDEVLPRCHGCVALPFLDGKMGKGVAGEAKFFAERGLPVWVIDYDQTAAYATYCTLLERFHSLAEERLLKEDPALVLSIEETRARTWMSPETYNKVKRPYETAHLIDFDPSKWTTEYIKSVSKK